MQGVQNLCFKRVEKGDKGAGNAFSAQWHEIPLPAVLWPTFPLQIVHVNVIEQHSRRISFREFDSSDEEENLPLKQITQQGCSTSGLS